MKGTVAAALAVSVGLSASAVWADELAKAPQSQPESSRALAERQFRAGLALQKVDDFEGAITAYRTSLQLYPTKSALFNLANCLQAMNRYVEALATFERLQADHARELDSAMLTATLSQSAELRRLTASLLVEVDAEGAEIRVDGRLLARAPMVEPLRLRLGDHLVEVSGPGYETSRQHVDLGANAESIVRIALTSSPPTRGPNGAGVAEGASSARLTGGLPHTPGQSEGMESPADGEDVGFPWRTTGWVTASVGVAALAGGALAGLWALQLDDGLREQCRGELCPRTTGSDVRRLDTLTTTTDVLLGLGATLTLAGGALLLFDRAQDEPPATSTSVGLRVGSGYVGGRFQGCF